MSDISGLEALVSDLDKMADNLDSAGDAQAWVYTGVSYSVFQEFGSSQNPKNPFMRPAAKEIMSQNLITEDFVENLMGDSAEDIEQQLMLMAMEARDKAKSYAPVDTGNLKASIVAAPTIEQARDRSRAQAWKEFDD